VQVNAKFRQPTTSAKESRLVTRGRGFKSRGPDRDAALTSRDAVRALMFVDGVLNRPPETPQKPGPTIRFVIHARCCAEVVVDGRVTLVARSAFERRCIRTPCRRGWRRTPVGAEGRRLRRAAPRHWAALALPCRCCRGNTHLRDEQGRPCHKVCAETEAARPKAVATTSPPLRIR
jgi:hypothetical protein